MRRTLILVASLWIAAAPHLQADGIILTPVAAPEVSMPDQRALLVWRNGTETLVIESRFVGQGEDFAWVVPLPAKPEIKPATAGILPALHAVFQPRIVPPASLGVLPFAFVVCLPALLFLFLDPDRAKTAFSRFWAVIAGSLAVLIGWAFVDELTRGHTYWGLLIPVAILGGIAWSLWLVPRRAFSIWLLAVIGMLLVAMCIPAFGKVRALPSGPAAGGPMIDRQLIGDYEVFTITGTDAGPINDWLKQHGFGLPAAAAPVVAEHASAGGCFIAARLHRTVSSATMQAPAPLVFTFKTPRPIYPMKLTGTGVHTALDVELFVFGDAVAQVDGLSRLSCGRVEFTEGVQPSPRASNKTSIPAPAEDLIHLSHTALRELCAGTQIATRLSGTLSPAAMRKDMVVEWRPFRKAQGLTKYAPSDAWGYGGLFAILALLAGGGVSFLCYLPGRAPVTTRIWVLTAALALGGGSAAVFPTVPVSNHTGYHEQRMRWRLLQECLEMAVLERPASDFTDAEFRQRFLDELAKAARETPSLAKELPQPGDAPGNYELRKLPGGRWRLIFIDDTGQEMFRPENDVPSNN
jgi:hypothetical protein